MVPSQRLLLLSADNLANNPEPAQDRQNGILTVFLKEFFEKVDLEKSHQTTTQNKKNYPACLDLGDECRFVSVPQI